MTAGNHPRALLDETIHSPYRLRICSLLRQLGPTDYTLLRTSLQISPSVLSKHLKKLEEAGYVALTTRTINTRSYGWASLTEQGQTAFLAHLAYLEQLIHENQA